SLERLPAVRGSDVVHEHHVAGLPWLAAGVGLVRLVEQLDDVLPDRITAAETSVERQAVFAVDVRQVLAHLGVYRPFVEERDLVEPAAVAAKRVTYHGAAVLPGAQDAIGLPLELDRVGAAVPLDGAAVAGAERLFHRGPEVFVVVAGEHPALPL